MNSETIKIIEDYYAAFNRGELDQFAGMTGTILFSDPGSGFPTGFFQQLHRFDTHAPVDRFAHIING